MARIRIVSIDYEGDSPDDVVRQAMTMFAERSAPAKQVSSLPTPPEQPVAELPAPAAPVRKQKRLSRRSKAGTGRRLVCDERPGETFSVQEAAALASCTTGAIYGVLGPAAQDRGAAVRGFHFHWQTNGQEEGSGNGFRDRSAVDAVLARSE